MRNIKRIDLKLSLIFVLLFVIILFPSSFVINQIFSSFYYNEKEQNTRELSSEYAQFIVNNYEHDIVLQMLEVMSEMMNHSVLIFDSEGVIVSESHAPQIGEEQLFTNEQFIRLSKGESINKTFNDADGNRHFVYTSPIIDSDRFYGAVAVFTSLEGIMASLDKIRNLLILSGIGTFFIALGITMVVSKKLSKPLVEMEKATRKMSMGDLSTSVTIPSDDEIGSLAIAINDLAKDLKRYRDTRREFLANISHELRTPLTYIDGYANIIKEKLYETEEEKNQYISIIQDEITRLTRLINDLSELSQMQEGKLSLQREWVNIGDVIENVLAKVKIKAEQKGLHIQFSNATDIPSIYVDELRIEQIFFNLIENAIRYTNEGVIDLITCHTTHFIQVSITDTGPGIPDEQLPFIFERFYRVDKSRSSEYGGRGLGLAIVKNLVDIQGGTITVESEVNEGTRFTVTFPTYTKQNKQVKNKWGGGN